MKTVYLCIHEKLVDKFGVYRTYPKKHLERVLGETFHVPKPLRCVVIKELHQLDLIKDLGRRRGNLFHVMPLEDESLKDINTIYQSIGFY